MRSLVGVQVHAEEAAFCGVNWDLGNVQISISYDASGRAGGTQTVKVLSYRRGDSLPNRHITFIVAEKLNSQFLLL